MSVEKLKQDIKDKIPRPVYVLYGPEGYLRAHYREKLIEAALGSEFLDFNLHVFDGTSFSMQEFLPAVESYPCFHTHVVLWIKNLMPNKYTAFISEILEAIRQMPETNSIIFEYDETVDPTKKCTELVAGLKAEKALFCPFTTPKEADLATWVGRHFAAKSKRIAKGDIIYLLSVCDNAMTNLINEIEKVCQFCQGDTVERRHIDAVVSKSLEAQVFTLGSAITGKDRARAFAILTQLLENREDPVMIFGAINSHFVRLVRAKAAIGANLSNAKTLELCGMKNEYALRHVQNEVRAVSTGYLSGALKRLRECDMRLKGSRMKGDHALEMLLGELLCEEASNAYH